MNRKKQFQKYYVLPDPEIKSKGYTTVMWNILFLVLIFWGIG